MTNKETLITVIIPTHKRYQLLERALKSIRDQNINESIEIIVISDVSDQKTYEICEKYLSNKDIFVERNGEPGPSASRNIGLNLANGKYIIFLDDDDAWHPNFINSFIATKDTYSNDFVYVNCSVVKERRLNNKTEFISENFLEISKSLDINIYVKNQVHMSCYIFPSSILKGIKFDTTMRAYEDWDFLLSVLDKKFPKHLPILGSRVYEVDDSTTDRRGSSDNAQNFNAVLDYLYVYRRHQSPNNNVRERRSSLLKQAGLNIEENFL